MSLGKRTLGGIATRERIPAERNPSLLQRLVGKTLLLKTEGTILALEDDDTPDLAAVVDGLDGRHRIEGSEVA